MERLATFSQHLGACFESTQVIGLLTLLDFLSIQATRLSTISS